jgi:ketosteroid isomerase-like protein
MSQENVDVVERAVAAVNERDINRYLACCTEDIKLRTPLTPIGGVYDGPDAIRRWLERVKAVGADRVLAFLRTTASGRASGIPTAADTSNVYDLVNG